MLKTTKWSLVYVVLVGVLLGPLGCGKQDPEKKTLIPSATNKGTDSNLGQNTQTGGSFVYTPPSVQELTEKADAGDPSAQAMLGESYARGEWGVQTNYVLALKYLVSSEKQKNPVAIYNLARMYAAGLGLKKDEEKAKQYFEAAFKGLDSGKESADPRWLTNLGLCYDNGTGVEKDPVEAAKLYHKAANQGYARAQANLGACYEYGNGVEKDPEEGMKWYRKAAEQGYAPAQASLGVGYDNGIGVEKDPEEAVKWYCKAADQGDASAQANLGACYEYGTGVEKDPEEGVKWYRKAAEQENYYAQVRLGVCYYLGTGVGQDLEEGVKWFRKVAEQGYAEAQVKLGVCYEYGTGVEKDLTEAVKWYRKAAEQGYAPAQVSLGDCYRYGDGVEKDLTEAVKWYRKAAEQGYAPAQVNLGLCYKNGTGVEKDLTQAVMCFSKAAEQGNADGQRKLSLSTCVAVDIDTLQNRAGVIYIINGREPFTGLSQGFYNNGQMKWEAEIEDGDVTMLTRWHQNGVLELSCRFSKGTLDDISTKAFKLISDNDNAKRLDGEFSAFQDDAVQIIAGSFVRGRAVGLLTAWSPEDRVWIKATYENGSPVQIERINNKGQLIAKAGFNRAKYEATFCDLSSLIGSSVEVFHGESVLYHSNGQKALQCTYKNGEIDGKYVSYYPNGQMDVQCIYKNGKIDGKIVLYHPNGQMDVQCTYKNGKIMGDLRGQMDFQYTYENGNIDGEYLSYHTNGQMAIQCTYKNGKIIGDLQSWALDGSETTTMVLIQGGTNAGTDPDLDLRAYRLTVNSFYMDVTEVTKVKWDQVSNWAVTNGYSFDHDGYSKGALHPVETVSWYDVVKWCNARSEKDGRSAVYTVNGAVYKTGKENDVVQTSAAGYRLPTDTEWEYAARGGLSSKGFPWVDTIDQIPWEYYNNTREETSPVCSFAPNGYGLYDMAGNVWEWCFDWIPKSPSGPGRVFRGGSWIGYANHLWDHSPKVYEPDAAYRRIGFRAVKSADQ